MAHGLAPFLLPVDMLVVPGHRPMQGTQHRRPWGEISRHYDAIEMDSEDMRLVTIPPVHPTLLRPTTGVDLLKRD